MKVITGIIYYFLIAVVVAIGALLLWAVLPVPGAPQIKIVRSGSMEPTVHVGSVVIIREASTYQVGDIITFGEETKTQFPTTHRIVQVDGEGTHARFSTKGDANSSPDPTQISFSSIHGRVVATIPYAGYMLDFAKKPLGFVILVVVPALLIIIEEVLKIIHEIRRMWRGKDGDGRGGTNTTYRPVPPPPRPSIDGIRMRRIAAPVSVYVKKLVCPRYVYIPLPVRTTAAGLMFTIAGFHMLPIGNTFSYYSDIESLIGSMFRAVIIDLQLVNLTINPNEQVELDAPFSVTTALGASSTPVIYNARVTVAPEDPAECSALYVHADSGSYLYFGPLAQFSSPAISTLGMWTWYVSLDPNNSTLPPDMLCHITITYHAWPASVSDALSQVFWDEKKVEVTVHYQAPPQNAALPEPSAPLENTITDALDTPADSSSQNTSSTTDMVL